MVWLNDNPLFGSQPESVMAALFLGILAAVPADPRHRGDHVRLTDRPGVGSPASTVLGGSVRRVRPFGGVAPSSYGSPRSAPTI